MPKVATDLTEKYIVKGRVYVTLGLSFPLEGSDVLDSISQYSKLWGRADFHYQFSNGLCPDGHSGLTDETLTAF